MPHRLALTIFTATGLALSAGAASATTSPSAAKPASVVQAYVADFNRGDAAAAAAHFSLDSEFFTPLGGCNPCTGRTAIQAKLSAAIANQTKLAIGRPRVRATTVTVHSELRSPMLPSGIDRAVGTFTATVRNGSIIRSRMEYDRSDPQTAALLNAIGQGTPTSGPPQ
jgi:hypothetical protein